MLLLGRENDQVEFSLTELLNMATENLHATSSAFPATPKEVNLLYALASGFLFFISLLG